MVDYIDGFLYIQLSLRPRDEAYLIMVNDHFDVFLDSVCKDFVEYFCINVHKRDWSEVLFPCSVFVWFRNEGFCCLISELGSVPSDCILWNTLESTGIRSSINV